MRLLVTGSAGFIGYHLAKKRLECGDTVVGIDNLNDYYDVGLKKARLAQLEKYPGFQFYPIDICDGPALNALFKQHAFQRVAHLAAQAGVRYSLDHPLLYIQANVMGFTQVIEACRQHAIEHLIYASTSSVYGANTAQPYKEEHATNHPLAIYAASKKSNELIAHAYSHLYQLPTTGLRFFTVYGPWGRPDMAFFSFTHDILAGIPIKIFNHGQMQRDFTYVDDIVQGLSLVLEHPAQANPQWRSDAPDAGSSDAPYRIYNIGNGAPVSLMAYIEAIEQATGKTAIKEYCAMQAGDVVSTHADTRRLFQDFDYLPKTHVNEGIANFVAWYKGYYRL
jgi:UDP-glucuronate 4-epimerase